LHCQQATPYLKLRLGGIRENLAGVICRIHLRIGNCDSPLLIDEIANSHWISCLDIAASAISQPNFTIGIAQQIEWEPVFTGKSSIGGDIIKTNAENDDIIAFESTILVAEPATFAGSASSVSLWIKPQKNLVSTKRRE
jgi:hypothetical protein